jgi:hypothetical protein
MRKQLNLIHRMNLLVALQFHNDSVLYEHICPESAIQLHLFVNERHRFLSNNFQSLRIEFVGKTALIGGLQQARTKATMNLDRRSNDAIGQLKH